MIFHEIKELNLHIGQRVFVLPIKKYSEITGRGKGWYYVINSPWSYDEYGVARTTKDPRFKEAMFNKNRIIPL